MNWIRWVFLAVLLVDITTNIMYYWARRQTGKLLKVMNLLGGYLFANNEDFREQMFKASKLTRAEWEKRIAPVRK